MADELRDEYQFDYGKAKPNRFAVAEEMRRRLVVLDLDVAETFRDSGTVNLALRVLLQSTPDRSAD